MNARCTCGAVLPDDARFCHKCGKPQYEEDLARLAAEEQILPSAAAPVATTASSSTAATGVSFRNSRAVWVTIVVAVFTLFAITVIGMLLQPLIPVILCAAGFAATRLYQTSAGPPLTIAGAARLGWMTGLWLFLAFAMMMAVLAIAVANTDAWEQLRAASGRMPQMGQLASMSQHDFLMLLLGSLPIFFLIFTTLPGLGGILGAKFPRRRSS